jgi:hypothetical protein
MSRYIPESLRKFVIHRACFRCEYCRLLAEDSFFPFHIDHIVSVKHGGKTIAKNLAYTCQICNWNKGSDIATFLEDDLRTPIRFFNPRIDIWDDHFEIEPTGFVSDKTEIGAATIKILNLNQPDSIIERREMIRLNIF